MTNIPQRHWKWQEDRWDTWTHGHVVAAFLSECSRNQYLVLAQTAPTQVNESLRVYLCLQETQKDQTIDAHADIHGYYQEGAATLD